MINFGSTTTLERPSEIAAGDHEPQEQAVPTAELVECNCPDVCDRDHETD